MAHIIDFLEEFHYEQRWAMRFTDMDTNDTDFYGADVVDNGLFKYHHSQLIPKFKNYFFEIFRTLGRW